MDKKFLQFVTKEKAEDKDASEEIAFVGDMSPGQFEGYLVALLTKHGVIQAPDAGQKKGGVGDPDRKLTDSEKPGARNRVTGDPDDNLSNNEKPSGGASRTVLTNKKQVVRTKDIKDEDSLLSKGQKQMGDIFRALGF